MKIIWIDTETTGLLPGINDPIQIAGMVEIDGQVKEYFNILSQPINIENIRDEALAVHGYSREDISKSPFLPAKEALLDLKQIMSRYVNKYDKTDKFWMAGFNTLFDFNMLKGWFKNLDEGYFGSWFEYKNIDVMQLAFIKMYKGELNIPSYKLETLANHYGIKIKAHDALSDIMATRSLFLKLMK